MSRVIVGMLALALSPSALGYSILHDNIGSNGGVFWNSGDNQGSQLDGAFGFDAGATDDFRLTASPHESGDWLITDLEWSGRFIVGQPSIVSGFNIIFWPDAGNQPAGSHDTGLPPKYNEALAIYSNVPAISAPSGNDFVTGFDYTATLPSPFLARADTTYWIEIQAAMNYPPLWSWQPTVGYQFNRPYHGFDLFGTPFWTVHPGKGDMAFRLGGQPFPEPTSGAAVLLGMICFRQRRHRAMRLRRRMDSVRRAA